eukprot:Gregarina_sp_Pseudo_9__5693@NODE_813_length_2176_cov_28_307440_g764_i0_p1_GENE_NODE_813_length_2176_cov_28_307440_g764_i0NODE_813_length_2176_cov_28_307440_g764_i0_p1_ORF_typecomplete_len310_score20_26adh_short/PF00106_25/2_9e37adh_short_C2/PF13561_6/5_2e23KR/PF08659_10/3_4e11DUF1776/PF08643_10/46DUF1776/PF08643_10/1_6e06Sacchrp_dh_NADP/PF03435_18/1_5e06Polysacc_synt_2/PF02719_15/0_00058Polysacc_synt_2/PF02719_15/2_6e03Epimerase/PF01370_21/0_0027NAD_binding_4/PF07993_12/0_0066NAD_binding_10/PF13
MFTAIGRFIIIYWCYCVVARCLWIWGPRNIRVDKLGKWVVVTGGTDGIGQALILELARRYPRLSFHLIGRNEAKLKATVAKLKSVKNYSGHVETTIIDFAKESIASTHEKLKKVKNLEVGLVINSVGQSYPRPFYWYEMDPEFATRLLRVNVVSTLGIVKLFLPEMEQRKKGAIILLGSGTTVTSEPLHSAYVSSKAAVKMLAQSLQTEVRSRNILVQCHQPGFVQSNMTSMYKGAIGMVSPQAYAWFAVQMLERSRIHWLPTPTIFSPHLLHALALWAFTKLPHRIGEKYRLHFRLSRRKRLLDEKTN